MVSHASSPLPCHVTPVSVRHLADPVRKLGNMTIGTTRPTARIGPNNFTINFTLPTGLTASAVLYGGDVSPLRPAGGAGIPGMRSGDLGTWEEADRFTVAANPCSWPITGSRSAQYISPLYMPAILIDPR